MLKIWCRMHFFTYWEKISLQNKIQYTRTGNYKVVKEVNRQSQHNSKQRIVNKDDGSVEFHDGLSEATHHPEGPRIFQFWSSSVKAIQTSLETAWKQCSEKPKELPLYQLRSKSGELVYNKLHLNDDSPSAAEECQPEETDLSTKPQGILHSSYN